MFWLIFFIHLYLLPLPSNLSKIYIQLNPGNSNCQGKLKLLRVTEGLSYRGSGSTVNTAGLNGTNVLLNHCGITILEGGEMLSYKMNYLFSRIFKFGPFCELGRKPGILINKMGFCNTRITITPTKDIVFTLGYISYNNFSYWKALRHDYQV